MGAFIIPKSDYDDCCFKYANINRFKVGKLIKSNLHCIKLTCMPYVSKVLPWKESSLAMLIATKSWCEEF